jgi:hypothetical protein
MPPPLAYIRGGLLGKTCGDESEVLLGTHWEHIENLMETHWQLEGCMLGTKRKRKRIKAL